jgi:ribonucleoside-diphosphate reductase alpha chain
MAIAPTASISIICGGSSPGIEPNVANSFTHKTLSGSFNVRNRYLKQLLQAYGRDDDETWSSITVNEGSVQHLDFLSEHEKAVFKNAFELDQRWIVDLGADRAPYICQSQSLNVFLPADVHKKTLHEVHFRAWQRGVKSLYYCRSKSLQRADVVATKVVAGQSPAVAMPPVGTNGNGHLHVVPTNGHGNGHASGNGHANGNANGHAGNGVETAALPLAAAPPPANSGDYEECLSCQ